MIKKIIEIFSLRYLKFWIKSNYGDYLNNKKTLYIDIDYHRKNINIFIKKLDINYNEYNIIINNILINIPYNLQKSNIIIKNIIIKINENNNPNKDNDELFNINKTLGCFDNKINYYDLFSHSIEKTSQGIKTLEESINQIVNSLSINIDNISVLYNNFKLNSNNIEITNKFMTKYTIYIYESYLYENNELKLTFNKTRIKYDTDIDISIYSINGNIDLIKDYYIINNDNKSNNHYNILININQSSLNLFINDDKYIIYIKDLYYNTEKIGLKILKITDCDNDILLKIIKCKGHYEQSWDINCDGFFIQLNNQLLNNIMSFIHYKNTNFNYSIDTYDDYEIIDNSDNYEIVNELTWTLLYKITLFKFELKVICGLEDIQFVFQNISFQHFNNLYKQKYEFSIEYGCGLDNIINSSWKYIFLNEHEFCNIECVYDSQYIDYINAHLDINILNFDENIYLKISSTYSNILKPMTIKNTNTIVKDFSFTLCPFLLSFKPRKLDTTEIINGNKKELLKLGALRDYKMNIPPIELYMCQMWELGDIFGNLVNYYIEKDHGLNMLLSMGFMKYINKSRLKNVLITKDKNIIIGIGSNISDLLFEVCDDSMDITSRGLISLSKKLNNITNSQKVISKSAFHDPPKNINEGFHQFTNLLYKRIKKIGDNDGRIFSKAFEPLIGLGEGTSRLIMGIQNSLNNENYNKIIRKYK